MSGSDILAHRGLWSSRSDMNSLEALSKAVSMGFGLEFDVRDYRAELVVSHDPPTKKTLTLRRLLGRLSEQVREKNLTLAINIKSDGLEKPLAALVDKFRLGAQSFVFDMSAPSMRQFLALSKRHGLRVATRISEYEETPLMLASCEFLWVDCFKKDWDPAAIFGNAKFRLKVPAFVSPELHGRPYERAWAKLKAVKRRFALCTDNPVHAREFFG